jgi:hypothetical protein
MDPGVLNGQALTSVMHQTTSGFRRAAIAAFIALGILSAGMSLVSASLTVVTGSQHAEIALDICHPLQVTTTVTHLLFAFPRVSILDFLPPRQGEVGLPPLLRLLKGDLEPEIPPPKWHP